MEEKEEKIENQKNSNIGESITEKNSENVILRPTTSPKEIMDRAKQNKSNYIAKRVESYNYKNGFLAAPSTNNSNIEKIETKEENKDYRIEIKTKKKNNLLLPILIVIILIIVGSVLIKQPFKNESYEPPKKADPEIIEPVSKLQETICSKTIDNSNFGYNYTEEKKFYSLDNKLKSYENINRFEYINTVPANLNNACYNINQNYKEYEGFSYTCTEKDNTYSYITKVDLEKLLDKDLSFTINSGIEKRTIKENLDDDINEYIKDLEEKGYSCNTE